MNTKIERILFKCLNCKEDFIDKITSERKYCSRRCSKLGARNPHWNHGKVGYNGIHSFIKRNSIKSDHCANCNIKTDRLDLANISNEYKRDLSDWEWLCRRCHMKKDGRMKNLEKRHNRGTLLKPIKCVCGKSFQPIKSATMFCSRACRGYADFLKVISRFTESELREIKYDLTYAQIYIKYKISQCVIYKIKQPLFQTNVTEPTAT